MMSIWKNIWLILKTPKIKGVFYFNIKITMNKNKILNLLIILWFILIFSIFKFEEYYSFHKKNIENNNYNLEINKKLSDFDLNYLEEINYIKLFKTPSKDLLNEIVNIINEAEERVYVEVYMFTEKRTKEAIIKAKKRWLDVKVILEKDPYMAYTINDKTFNELKKNNIDVVWSDRKNYSLNHSKMLLIDDLNIISTWNLTYSTFTQNRDFFIFIKDEKINWILTQTFENDFKWIKKSPYSNNIIMSPDYSRNKIIKLLETAEKDIKIYMQYFNDIEINDKLIELKKEKNINIDVVIAETAIKDENTKMLIKNWINIKKIPKYKMHAKAILVDEKYLFIWSINFSSYSIDKNREIWLIIKNNKIISDFINIFYTDFK